MSLAGFSPAMNRLLLSLLFIALGQAAVALAKQPNFLIIMADDCTYNDLPLYGGQNARTPNIDRLASQGSPSTAPTSPRRCASRAAPS